MLGFFSRRPKQHKKLALSELSDDSQLTNRLFSGFYENLDMEKWRSSIQRVRQDSGAYGRFLLGGGYHFQAYRNPANDQDFRYCLKLATSQFIDSYSEKHLRDWIQAVKTLVKNRVAMIPPMEFIQSDDYLAIVMPELSVAKGLVHKNSDFSGKVTLLEKELRELGLEFRDGYQVGTWEGCPYIYDFSDLSFIQD